MRPGVLHDPARHPHGGGGLVAGFGMVRLWQICHSPFLGLSSSFLSVQYPLPRLFLEHRLERDGQRRGGRTSRMDAA